MCRRESGALKRLEQHAMKHRRTNSSTTWTIGRMVPFRCCSPLVRAGSAGKMKIRTSTLIRSTPAQIWPLLTQSSMEVPGCFCLGLPRPVACELPNSVGEVGSERRCISDRGVVVQKITAWTPPSFLRFEMVSTDHGWGPEVESIREEFHLCPGAADTRVTRTTTLVAAKPFRMIKEIGFYMGLKRVHFFVFKNWRAQAEAPK